MAIQLIDSVALVDAEGLPTGTKFFVGDDVTVQIKDLTATDGVVYFSGRIDSIHRVEGEIRLDASAQFESNIQTIKFTDVVGIIAYVAPTAAVAPVAAEKTVVAAVVEAPVTATEVKTETVTEAPTNADASKPVVTAEVAASIPVTTV